MNKTALLRLSLHRFRSHTQLEFDLLPKPVVLFGANGAGKTNILEAISLLAPGRGLRHLPYHDALQHESDAPWAIHADLHVPDGTFSIGTGLQINGNSSKRTVRIDGSTTSAGALARLVRQVWLTPAQDRIFSGARGLRLKFYDRLVFSMFPEHGKAVSSYEKALRQRQKLLDEPAAEPAWLHGLEQQMAEYGAKMIDNRAQTLARLQTEIDSRSSSPFPQADLALLSDADLAVPRENEPKQIKNWLLAGFADTRRQDTRAGRTLSGPHRANLAVSWRAKQMPASDCSTGEQKALLVGLTLAHARAVTAQKDTSPPLILLDEACAHLDASRRAALIEELCALSGQAWLTGTDRSLFEAFGKRAQYLPIG